MVNKILVPAVCVVGTALLTLGGVAVAKVNKIAKKFDKGVSDLGEVTAEQIRERLIEEAVKKASDEKVERYVSRMHDDILAEGRNELRREAAAAVTAAKNDIQSSVTDEISRKAAMIDLEDMKKEVRKKAEERVLEKFDENFQDILDKFNGNLENVIAFYSKLSGVVRNAATGNDGGHKITFTL